ALELRRLRTVLEEERVVLGGVGPRRGFCLVEVGTDAIELGTLRLNQCDLLCTRLLRHKDDRPYAGALGGPRGCRTVIARRGGHDDGRSQLFEHCLGAATLEGAELMLVFALQVDAVA